MVPANCPAYADDLAILAAYAETLQLIINMVQNFANAWRIQFNAGKSAIMVFPLCQRVHQKAIYMNNMPIPYKDFKEYLGINIGDSGLVINTMVRKGKNTFNSMLGLGSTTGGINPIVGSKIYWSVVVPSMTYGAEVMDLGNEQLQELEKQHRQFGKRLQCLSSKTSNPAAHSQLGWYSLTAHIEIRTLTFFYNIFHLQSSIFKTILINRLIDLLSADQPKRGPIAQFVRICRKYNLVEQVEETLRSGTPIAKDTWKAQCSHTIHEHELKLFQIECLMYKKLQHLPKEISMNAWWRVAFSFPKHKKACNLMMKFVVGEEPLRANHGRFNKNKNEKICKICNEGVIEDKIHFMFHCQTINTERQMLIRVTAEAGISFHTAQMQNNCQMIINPRNASKYRKAVIAQSLYRMYRKRKDKDKDTIEV